jgi:hypothetical protein
MPALDGSEQLWMIRLFQGEFGEMHLRDKAVDPAKVAASVGFSGGKS